MKKTTYKMLIDLMTGAILFIIFGIISAAFSGCSTISAGVGYAPQSLNRPEVQLNNPIGYIGGTKEWYRDGELVIETFARHYSGIGQTEIGGGFNLVGAQVTLDLTNR